MIYHGDCLEIMQDMDSNSVDTIITDPPYALEFMGKGWDKVLPPVEVWTEALRIAKPGSMLMAFGGTRTYHRLTCAIEDGGWEIRDCVMWVYGSGFPKSHDISKGIDSQAGATREIVGRKTYAGGHVQNSSEDKLAPPIGTFVRTQDRRDITDPVTDAAQTWNGYGTALKPAWEPIVLAMKPLDGTFAQNALKWGVAGLWIDGARVPFQGDEDECESKEKNQYADFESGPMTNQVFGKFTKDRDNYNPPGRWPANVIHDGSEEVLQEFAKAGERVSGGGIKNKYGSYRSERTWNTSKTPGNNIICRPSRGTAARFFYCAKASKAERNKGCEGLKEDTSYEHKRRRNQLNSEHRNDSRSNGGYENKAAALKSNYHPTVKPVALMRYLCRLTRMPEGGTVLDPFMGSGTTGIACKLEGRSFVGIEKEKDYCEIAKNRIEAWEQEEVKVDDQQEFEF